MVLERQPGDEALAFDEGVVCSAVLDLVQDFYDDTIVMVEYRDSIVGNGRVTTLVPMRPLDSWSSSERVMWSFLTSVAGRGQSSMRDLAGYFRSTFVTGRILAVINAMMTGMVPAVKA